MKSGWLLHMKNLRYLLLLPALLCATNVFGERTFKWTDHEGHVHYGNRVPPEYAKQERKVINGRGRTVQVYDAAKTPEQREEARRLAKIEARNKVLAEKQAVHDRSLLATYLSEQDMLLAKNGKVAAVDALLQLTRSRVNSMNERLLRLTEEAATYERSGKALPAWLESQINNIRVQITTNEAFIKEKEGERNSIVSKFDDDIKRYIELTANKPDANPPKQRLARIDAASNKQKADLSRNDQLLLTTYEGEADIILTRDQKISSLEELIKLTQIRIQAMQIELAELSDNADEYESRGKKVPEVLLGRMKNVMRGIRQGEDLAILKQQEKKKLEKQYNEDIERYRLLTAKDQ
ncbi:MAG: DUF4124 domain-containing protein [Gammaproteobacteria bacterium]|nr:DUF4124 domain-containing protein [Gammaproteobacteria bacterium]